jgi:hypothetical protein
MNWRKKIGSVLFLILIPSGLLAQRFSPAIWDCASERWMVSAGGLYLRFEDQLGDFDLRGKVPVLDMAVAPFEGLILIGGMQFGPVRLERNSGTLSLKPRYPVDAGLVLGPFPLRNNWLGFSFFLWGKRLNYRGQNSFPHTIGDLEWTRTQDYQYRAYFASSGLLLRVDLWRASFFGGPVLSRYFQHLELEETLTDGQQVVPFSEALLEETSPWYSGYVAGVGVRLPQRFSISVQIYRTQAGQIQVFLSLAQTGSP